jgi:5-methylcytosine-specific restriction endonuclease McrA
MRRTDVFLRDGRRCVYCGGVFEDVDVTVDHVQPRVRQGDASGGNLVTACRMCNRRKGHQSLAQFLASDSSVRTNFFRYATAVWPRHLRAVEEELRAAGIGAL